MAPLVDRLKANFNVATKLDPFFTGGKVQVTESGKLLLCQCGDRVQVIDNANGKNLKSLVQEEDEIISFSLAPDNNTVVTSHKSGLLRHWNLADGNVVRTWKSLHLTPVVEIEFDSTSTLVATAGTDGSLKVWDIQKQYCTHNLKGGIGLFSLVRFHPDPKKLYLYGASIDGKIRCWNLKTSQMVSQMEGHYSAVTGMGFFNGTERAISASRDKVLILWDLSSYKPIKIIPTFECIEALLAIPHGCTYPLIKANDPTHLYVLTAGEKGCLRVWDVSTGNDIYTSPDSIAQQPASDGAPVITQLVSSRNDNNVYVVTYDHNIIAHRLEDLSLVKQYAGYNDDILDIVWFGEGETHLAVATNSIHIKVYNVDTLNCTLLKGHSDLVLALAVSRADPSVLISSSKDNSIRVWKMINSPFSIPCISVGNAHTSSVGTVALSKTKLDFLVSGSQDTCLKIWKISSHDPTAENVLTVSHTVVAHDKDINAVCISPNDKLIASGSQDKLGKVWDSSDLRLLGVLRGHRRGLWTVQFSPSDQILASGSTDSTIKLWSLSDFSCLKSLEGHDSSVLRIHFLAKGYQIVSAASDGLIKLWTIKSSECVATMDAHHSKVWALAVRNDETMLASGAGDSTLILWKDVTKEDRESTATEKEKRILEEQLLANLIKQGQLLDALTLAITLEQPFRALNILKDVMDQGGSAIDELEKKILTLSNNQKDILFRYATTWNTNSRHCHQAQMVLKILLSNHTPDELLSCPSLRDALASLMVYNERHMQRLNRLRQNTAIFPYTVAKIQATRKEV